MTTTQEIPATLELPDRYVTALQIKDGTRKVRLPHMPGWSKDPNNKLRPFQERGVAYLYVAKKAVLADPVGLGKTPQALGVTQLLKTQERPYRTLILVRSYNNQMQWLSETHKFTDLRAIVVDGTKGERMAQYSSWWEVLITRYSLLLRDLNSMRQLEFDQVILDEPSDAGVGVHHHSTKTARFVKVLTKDCPRVVELDATPIQTSLLDMHSLLETLRLNIFGPLPAFELRYVRREPIKIKRGHSIISTTRIIGYRNMEEFKERLKPFVLRRKLADVEAEMPAVTVSDIWLELPRAQRRYYEQARKGIVTLYEAAPTTETDKEDKPVRITVSYNGEIMTLSERSRRVRAGFHHLQYACDTTLAFNRQDPESVKIDWLMNELKHDLRSEKVVVFSKYKISIEHVMTRFHEAGIGSRRFTGDESPQERQQTLHDFWNDPKVRVLVGTNAMERGLNLQKSAYLINLNQMWNPTRMQQLLGRIRRMGSEHSRVFCINLLTENTIEEKLQRLLIQRAAVADYVWEESNDLFDSLPDHELMALIQE